MPKKNRVTKKLSREKIIQLLEETKDLQLSLDPEDSKGHGDLGTYEEGQLVLTRADLEKLIATEDEIAFSSFHSSGTNSEGNHSSN